MLLIDKLSQKPVYEQVIEGIERNILLGIYPPGSLIPSLRELSVTLGINPNTIQKSYAELTRDGIITPSPGSGCYVSADAIERLREKARKRLPELHALAKELQIAGVTQEELLAVISSVYPENGVQTPVESKEEST